MQAAANCVRQRGHARWLCVRVSFDSRPGDEQGQYPLLRVRKRRLERAFGVAGSAEYVFITAAQPLGARRLTDAPDRAPPAL